MLLARRGGNIWPRYLHEYVRPVVGEKVLDIGCGPAEVLQYRAKLHYTGFDISSEYIEAAKRRFGEKGRFWCSDIGLANLEQESVTFVLALATGILHHLGNERAKNLFTAFRFML